MARETQVTLDKALELARHHHEAGNLILADRTYRDILNAVPDHYPSVHYLGIVLYQRGNLREALDYMARAVKAAPKDAQAWSNYAAMLSEDQRIDDALKAWGKALRLSPDNADIHSNRANALWKIGKYKDAEAACRKALAADPKHADALLNIGNALAAQGKQDDAIPFWQKAVKLYPDFSKAWNNWGNALRDLGKIAESEEKCRKAVEHDPQNPQALNNLANALRDLGRPEDAEPFYRRATQVDPAYADAHNNLATCLIDLGRFDEAATAARYATSFDPQHAGAYGNLSIALRELGHMGEAETAAMMAINAAPKEPDGYLDLCDVLMMGDRHDEAEAALSQARKLAPAEPRIYMKLSSVLERLLRPEEALAMLQKAMKITPDNPFVWQRMAGLYFITNDMDRATEACDKALELKPQFVLALSTKANILQSLGKTKESEKIVRRGLKIAPHTPALYYSLAQVKKFTDKNDPDFKAMLALADKVTRQGQMATISLHFALFKAYEDMGDTKKAFDHLKIANDMRRRLVPYNVETGRAYNKSLIKTFTKKRMQELDGAGYKSDLPVFIVGMPRSGTTLTEQIIAAHPDAFGAGELYEFTLAEKKHGPLTDADSARKIGKAYIDRVKKRVPDGQAAKRVTDKMPGNYMRIAEIRAALPRAKIIHCRRGAMDTLLSCYKQNFARGQYWSYDLEELAEQYSQYQEIMAHWRKILPPDAFLEIDYEETVSDFETQARRLIDFVGLPWHPACLKPHKQKRAVLTASKMQVIKPVYKTSVKGWKRYEKMLKPLRDALAARDIPPDYKGHQNKTQKRTTKK